ncbi:hypothetical protein CDAR_302721 [Caerostris darwini]|uniref:Uncharacterized protein n=1 Tax=Caerostris darwini TaxID=1538125 RepID=A0AAV4V4Q8_9ARAC|nr:hypothetical protein CDAR_302721 [Caerostris darwini]
MITREAFSTCWRRTFLVGCLRRFPFSVFLSGEDKDECDGDDGEEEEDVVPSEELQMSPEEQGHQEENPPVHRHPCSISPLVLWTTTSPVGTHFGYRSAGPISADCHRKAAAAARKTKLNK